MMERRLELKQVIAPDHDPVMRYALSVQQALAGASRFPDDVHSDRGTVKLRLTVLRDGSVKSSLIEEASGDPAFDLAVLELVRAQPVFAPFPQEIAASELILTVPVVFSAGQR